MTTQQTTTTTEKQQQQSFRVDPRLGNKNNNTDRTTKPAKQEQQDREAKKIPTSGYLPPKRGSLA